MTPQATSTRRTATRTTAAAVAATFALILGTAACTPDTGGAPALNAGCFETVFGPTWGRYKVHNDGAAWFVTTYGPSSPTCVGTPTAGPTQIFAGDAHSNSTVICEALYGPGSQPSDAMSQLIVPSQNFWHCI